jgi:hypothetical protein
MWAASDVMARFRFVMGIPPGRYACADLAQRVVSFQRHVNVLCRHLTLFDEAVAWIFAGTVSNHPAPAHDRLVPARKQPASSAMSPRPLRVYIHIFAIIIQALASWK